MITLPVYYIDRQRVGVDDTLPREIKVTFYPRKGDIIMVEEMEFEVDRVVIDADHQEVWANLK